MKIAGHASITLILASEHCGFLAVRLIMVKKIIIKFIGILKRHTSLVSAIRWINLFVRKISSQMHKVQAIIEWSIDNPEYYDHYIDLHWQWKQNRASFPMERGVFSSLALNGGATLDLCCGDGFNSFYFYSLRSESVVGIDFDKQAIRWAKRNFAASNLNFIEGDIRTDIPEGPFDNIVWDAAVEHFTEIEIESLMKRIKAIQKPNGTLSGYTIVEPKHGGKHLHQHEYEFHDQQDLARFLTPYYKNVQVFSTSYPMRTNLYFFASDGQLPFDKEWNLVTRRKD